MTATIESTTQIEHVAERTETATLYVHGAGLLTTVQDSGRAGLAHLGVGASGPVDRGAAELANRLVGNSEGAGLLENLMGGVQISVSHARYVSVTGAPVDVHVDGRIVIEPQRFYLLAGQHLSIGQPRYGMRTYLAISGGIVGPRVFGSTSTDSLSGLGPEPLAVGDRLMIGQTASAAPYIPLELVPHRMPQDMIDLEFHWGPRDSLFSVRDRHLLTRSRWVVSDQINRVGIRLTGPELEIGSVSIPSEGMVLGSIQVPPSGQPIVFLADHPVTGGYPVIGVVSESDLDRLGQAAPGAQVSFSPLATTNP